MSIKTILAPANGDDSSDPFPSAAVGVARHLDAHLEVLHVSPSPAKLVPLIEDGMPVEMIEQIKVNAASLAAQERDAARAAYDRICAASGVAVAWREIVGSKTAILPAAARFADLLTMSKPREYFAETLDAALFESGRPVLILPRRSVSAIGNRVVIAWNGSVGAARAVTAAVPFFRLAAQVDVVMVGTLLLRRRPMPWYPTFRATVSKRQSTLGSREPVHRRYAPRSCSGFRGGSSSHRCLRAQPPQRMGSRRRNTRCSDQRRVAAPHDALRRRAGGVSTLGDVSRLRSLIPFGFPPRPGPWSKSSR